jgi:hypothetical protein
MALFLKNKVNLFILLGFIGYWISGFGISASAAFSDYKLEMPLLSGQEEISASPGEYVKMIFTYGIAIVGVLALFAVAYGGIRYMLSGSSETGKSEAKRWIFGAVSGVVLLFASYLILKTINPELISLEDPELAIIDLPAHSGYGPSVPNNELPPNIQVPPGAAANCAGMKNTYGDLINKWANHYGVDPNLIAAIIMQESRGNPNVVSSKGAKGLMQIMTKFHKIDDPFDPNQNIQTGTKFLSRLLKLYNGNKSKALAAYNCGEGCVAERWPNNLYPETQKYIEEVPMWESQCAGTEGFADFFLFFAAAAIELKKIIPLHLSFK